jgi:hypothetical protein
LGHGIVDFAPESCVTTNNPLSASPRHSKEGRAQNTLVSIQTGEKMSLVRTGKVLGFLISGAMILTSAVPVMAQSDASSATASGTDSAATASTTKAQKKAQRKAARKRARENNTAELKKLESNGYQPTQNDPNYPQNLQNAEKKASAGQAASQ